MTPAQRKNLDAALAVLRDPDGTGRARVSHGFGGDLKVIRCQKPIDAYAVCALDTGHEGACSRKRGAP